MFCLIQIMGSALTRSALVRTELLHEGAREFETLFTRLQTRRLIREFGAIPGPPRGF